MSNIDEKYLIGSNFKAIRKGAFVEASIDDGEFIITSDLAEKLTVATLKEVAISNKLSVPSKIHHKDLVVSLMEHLKTLKLPKVDKMTETQTVEKIVAEGIEAGLTDDEMKVMIVNEGISFKNAGKLFNSVMESQGHRVSAASVAEAAAKLMAGVEGDEENGIEGVAPFAPETSDDVQSMIDKITSEVKGATEKQAKSAIRKYAKANDITMPKAKSTTSRGGGGNIQAKVRGWMLENRDCTVELIAAKIKDLKPEITESQLKKYVANSVNSLEFAKKWSGEESTPAE